jgi:RNA-binding protein
MPLTERQKKRLRGLGHKLKPVIIVGSAGITAPLLEEFDRSIEHHELMKVKLSLGNRALRDAAIAQLCEHSGAELVQRVGNVALLLKQKKKNSKFAAL